MSHGPKPSRGNKVGMPATPIDPFQLEFMASLFSSQEEMAFFFGISQQALNQRLQREPLKSAYERGLTAARLKLRSAQFKAATEKLNPAMLIWLGKQKGILNQRDQPPPATTQDVNINVRYVAEWGATPASLGEKEEPSSGPEEDPEDDL